MISLPRQHRPRPCINGLTIFHFQGKPAEAEATENRRSQKKVHSLGQKMAHASVKICIFWVLFLGPQCGPTFGAAFHFYVRRPQKSGRYMAPLLGPRTVPMVQKNLNTSCKKVASLSHFFHPWVKLSHPRSASQRHPTRLGFSC